MFIHSPSGLSATKLADLPGAQPFQTALGTGGNMTQIASLQPGHVLANRFEIMAQIGAGGMGVVYRAHDRNQSEDIAIKVMLPGLISSDVAKQRFMNEAKIAIKLGHQHIVNTYDVQMDGVYLFITMELLEGTNLRQLMTEKKNRHDQWSENEVLNIIRPLCEALSYAHRFTIHRDIKPENVWISRDGSIKLMDFGIARLMTDSQMTQTSAVLGTAYYMAPEQLVGAKHVDHRADQYSVGVLVYELLAERIPSGRFKPISEVRDDISPGLSEAVDQALAGHAEDRYPDMQAFAQGLQEKKGQLKAGQAKAGITKLVATTYATLGAAVKSRVRVKPTVKVLLWLVGLPILGLLTLFIVVTGYGVSQYYFSNEYIAMTIIPGKNYEIGNYEVTQGQWKEIMGNNPSKFASCGDTCPVENMSLNDIKRFIKKINAKTGLQYRLPTEDEWQYACYGNEQTEYCGGNDLDAVGWYKDNSNGQTHPVGQKQANGYGLYDMNGNVFEWTNDCWGGNCAMGRVVRGGVFAGTPEQTSASFRGRYETSLLSYYSAVGFRLARTL